MVSCFQLQAAQIHLPGIDVDNNEKHEELTNGLVALYISSLRNSYNKDGEEVVLGFPIPIIGHWAWSFQSAELGEVSGSYATEEYTKDNDTQSSNISCDSENILVCGESDATDRSVTTWFTRNSC